MDERSSILQHYLEKLFPLCRSLTGTPNRESLKIIQEIIPLRIHEIPSGRQVYDWKVPLEWSINSAYIEDGDGNRIIDFSSSNLHVVSYSQPVDLRLSWKELKKHLHTHSTLPEAIPYRTTYYKKNWGFCVTHSQYQRLESAKEPLHVAIDSNFKSGSLSYGEYILKGASSKEVLISSYICHPSMANDSLSGVLLVAFLAYELSKLKSLNYTYRFVFVPETIGAISYCHSNEEALKSIDFGFVVTTAGGPGDFHVKHSFDSQHFINGLVTDVLDEEHVRYKSFPFDIHGSDERQYSSQAFGINICTLAKDKYYEYPYYHTSFDDLSFVSGENINSTLQLYIKIFNRLEELIFYKSTSTYCEVMLSKHDLYGSAGGSVLPSSDVLSVDDLVLWLLFYCDGNLPLQTVSSRLGVPLEDLFRVVELLVSKGLLERA